jgi:quercetin dioxygenase-like cupin family protein
MAAAPAPLIPTAVHLGDETIPWIDTGAGIELKVLLVREKEGLWIIRNRFQPGVRVPTHRHTGPVFGYTVAGAWRYEEYDYVNRAGSFLYEPAGSVHTLKVPDTNRETTDVWFQMYGCNLNLDADGKVEAVIDGKLVLGFYLGACEAKGLPRPPVLID